MSPQKEGSDDDGASGAGASGTGASGDIDGAPGSGPDLREPTGQEPGAAAAAKTPRAASGRSRFDVLQPKARQDASATFARLTQAVAAVDDGQMMRTFFYGLLAAALVFVVMDWRTISAEAALSPASDPASPMSEPVLPPALTTGEPDDAPAEVTTEPEALRQAIRFELQPGGILLAKGAIDAGAAQRFAAEIDARGEYVKVVQLDSPGGSVSDALAMSKLIRDRQLDTRVEKGALCASSCPLILSGGVERTVAEGAVVGVHQIFNGTREKLTPEMAMSEARHTTAIITRHLDAMGIAPGLWQRAMETPPDRLAYLSAKDMRAFALTTPGDGGRNGGGVVGKARTPKPAAK
jgi:hypothetical protein